MLTTKHKRVGFSFSHVDGYSPAIAAIAVIMNTNVNSVTFMIAEEKMTLLLYPTNWRSSVFPGRNTASVLFLTVVYCERNKLQAKASSQKQCSDVVHLRSGCLLALAVLEKHNLHCSNFHIYPQLFIYFFFLFRLSCGFRFLFRQIVRFLH